MSTAQAAAALLAQVDVDEAAMALATDTEAALGHVAEQAAPSSTAPSAAPDQAHEADTDDDFLLGEPEPEDAEWLIPDETDDDDIESDYAAEAAVEDDNEFEDPETQRLRRELAAARKKAAHFEQQNARTARKAWKVEAGKYYPLADLDGIEATSKRGFMRDAKAQHDRLKPTFDRFKKQEQERIRAQAAKDWGKPYAGGQIPSQAADQAVRVDNALKTRNLGRVFKEMLLPTGGE